MANHLASETSPYLLQHAHNPVDWWPWGEEALAKARAEERPILLSIGYAACHWCHVMERESFEDEATAAQMNEQFVCIKVDREERPDLDGIYMQATQAMTGQGGWPMTVFLTPQGEPFYAGTYFPPDDRHGMPSFRRVLSAVADAWQNRRDQVGRTTASMRELYAASSERTRTSGALDETLLTRAITTLRTQFEPRFGGFGGAPKFPPTMTLDFALRQWARTGNADVLHMVQHTFRRMARGGIYDQVGGGFARYSVDAYWLVPHFEKMLYDNALLVRLGAALWQATRDDEVRRVTEETLGWIAREMTSPEGGFYSSLDADSEGHEGRYYVWDASELASLLGEDAALLKVYWGVTAEGNFEGRNILFVPHDPEAVARAQGVTPHELRTAVARAQRILYEAREKRVRPGLDDKILAAWNGLMLRGVAEAARAFGDSELRALAERNGEFLFRDLVRDGGGARLPELQGRFGAHRRLSRGLRRDRARRAGRVRADLRPHLARARAPARRRDPRPLLGRQCAGAVRHRIGRRAARHAAARRDGQRDAERNVAGDRAAAEARRFAGDRRVRAARALSPGDRGGADGAPSHGVRPRTRRSRPRGARRDRGGDRGGSVGRAIPIAGAGRGGAVSAVARARGRLGGGGNRGAGGTGRRRADGLRVPIVHVRRADERTERARGATRGNRRAAYSFISHVSDVSGLPKVSWTSSRIFV
ncbi:MAG TPA: thioredoxin domain-containing protein [Gemmatimonadaceae bacterium]